MVVRVQLCEVCSAEFEAKRPAARFCSATCRQRAHRGPDAAGAGRPVVAAVSPPDENGSSLASSTAAELDAAGRLTTAAGRAAMLAAEYLDGARRETGSGIAALLKAHRDALAEALKGAARAADGVDELRDRRARKAAGA